MYKRVERRDIDKSGFPLDEQRVGYGCTRQRGIRKGESRGREGEALVSKEERRGRYISFVHSSWQNFVVELSALVAVVRGDISGFWKGLHTVVVLLTGASERWRRKRKRKRTKSTR